MSVFGTISFWTRREREERRLAESAADGAVRRIHLFMARCYRRHIDRSHARG